MELEGKVALVTGGARRLGRVIARELAASGADLALHHNASAQAAGEAAAEFGALGSQVEVFRADLRDPDAITRLIIEVEAAFGKLDVLVNNAACFVRQSVLDITAADWDSVMDLNLRAPFFCAQAAARLMRSRGSGVIVNIADVGGLQPWPNHAHHSISKAGMIMLTRVLARALAPEIRVNAIAPGPVLPPDGLSVDEEQKLAEKTALKRLGDPTDVAAAVIFLVRSDYVTGETIVVDGGKTIG